MILIANIIPKESKINTIARNQFGKSRNQEQMNPPPLIM
jgi:hypothetical protein